MYSDWKYCTKTSSCLNRESKQRNEEMSHKREKCLVIYLIIAEHTVRTWLQLQERIINKALGHISYDS